ncbi:MAG: ATP-binding protein [Clostridiales Family XIII bacterium]|nr:ATP-binding protein [Clostridiales Family XIII bacterium]
MYDTADQNLIRRNVEKLIRETTSDTPVTVIQGARQVGKSTITSIVTNQIDSRMLSLDNPNTLLAAKANPLDFVNQYRTGMLVIDEVQLCPELMRVIKLSVDEDRRPGRFLLTGSADLLHITGANESLAGRAETVKLYPFSQGELRSKTEDFITKLLTGDIGEILAGVKGMTRDEYISLVSIGGYPDAIKRDARRRKAYFRNYLTSVLDHDAAKLSGLAHINKLTEVLKVLSARTSGELVHAHVATLTQIPETSIHAYIRLLKDLSLIHELPAWGRNLTKRAVGRKKISIIDTGLAGYLNGYQEETLADLTQGEAFGALLETFVVSELFKQQTWSDTDYTLYHYRDREKREVDIVVELPNGKIIALEVKAKSSLVNRDLLGIKKIKEVMGDRFVCGIVLHSGHEAHAFEKGIYSAPLNALWAL